MSKLMLIVGILVLAAAIALGLVVFFSPGRMQVLGLTPDTAAILLAAGLISVGLGGVIEAVESAARSTRDLREWLAGHDSADTFEPARPISERVTAAPSIAPEQASAALVPAAATVAAAAVTVTEEATRVVEIKGGQGLPPFEKVQPAAKTATEDTLASLEKAKSDLTSALGLPPEVSKKTEAEPEPDLEPELTEPESEPESEMVEETEEPADADSDDEQLYVIEEKLVRGRPARVLSDGTVEAETDEGWMRFENTEHLEEYLDAVSPTKA